MSFRKLSLCLFLFAIVQISSSLAAAGTSVTIRNSKDMSADMKLDAVNVLKNAINSDSDLDACEILADYFQEAYPDYNWHVVDFNGYKVRVVKSISLGVNDDKYYLLFATNK